MMMITRTESHIEIAIGETRSFKIDVARIVSAMLAAERAPCGRVFHALLLMGPAGADPIRIDGAPYELTELHACVVETMLEASERPTTH